MTVNKLELLDELDIAIIGYLYKDGRAPFTEIAKELNVSHATIRNRYLRMAESLSLTITTVVDPYVVGFQAGAIIKCVVNLPLLQDVIDQICTFPEVTWAVETTGRTNLLFVAWCKDFYHLNQFLVNRLFIIEGVEEIETGLYSRIYRSFPAFYRAFPGTKITGSGDEEDRSKISLMSPENQHVSSEGIHQLNDVDIQILKQLAQDGRRSFTDIARDIGVAQSTVYLRYKQLLQNKILKVACWLPLSELGFSVTAHFDLSISPPKLHQATEMVLNNDESTWVYHQYGYFNLGIDVYCIDKIHLDEFILNYINPLEGLRHMEMLFILKTHKYTTVQPNLELLNINLIGD